MTLAESLISSGRTWSIEELDELIETTLTGNIGTVNLPMKVRRDDPTMGGRNKVWRGKHRITRRGPELNRG